MTGGNPINPFSVQLIRSLVVSPQHSQQTIEFTLSIELGENGYSICDRRTCASLVEGIKSWDIACELHEMLEGEREEQGV
jgi:hypothetical protein